MSREKRNKWNFEDDLKTDVKEYTLVLAIALLIAFIAIDWITGV